MFLLRDLPDRTILQRFAAQYPEMDITSTEACLYLLKAASTLLIELEKHFAEYGISQARFLALIILIREESGQLKPVDIAEKMGVSLKNTSRLLESMQQDQLIQRTAHKTDKRASIVSATAKGEKILSLVLPKYYQIMNKMTAKLNAKDKVLFTDYLMHLDLDLSTPKITE